MPFGLCNAAATFQRCMTAIFHELIEDVMEVFMDKFSIFRSSFDHCLANLEKMLKRCEETNLEFDIKIRDKKGDENLTADDLSRLENLDLGKLTKAEIRDLFSEELLMTISDKMVLQDEIMGSPPLQEKFLRPGSTGLISFAMHENWFDLVTHGIDFIRPFPSSNGNKYILVVIDYVSKCVEAQAFPTSDARNVLSFLKELFARFGIPKSLISDKGTHFCNYQMERAMNRFLQINELDELRLDAYESSIFYKERMKRWHDKRIKTPTEYEKGDKLLLFNYCLRLFPGKLKSIWYGPFTISRDMKGGAIKLCDEEGNEFIVNKQRVKPYQKDISYFDKDDDVTLDGEGGVTVDGLSAIATKFGTHLMLDSYTSDMCIQSWVRSSYARALIEVRADVDLKDNIVMAMPKLVGDGFYTCIVREECPKIMDLDVVKNMKKPNQAARGVSVGPKVTLVDDEGKPLTKVDSLGDHDSEDEVASADNDMANFLASKKDGYGTNSLFEQWKDSYVNVDYEFYPYDDDMYEGQDIPDKIQDICDNLDIKVRGRKKK
ncbi:DNA-directed DNA polymerase [Tanacetum coccineum]